MHNQIIGLVVKWKERNENENETHLFKYFWPVNLDVTILQNGVYENNLCVCNLICECLLIA